MGVDGRRPAIRQEIKAALEAYIKGDATPEQIAMFEDWSVRIMKRAKQNQRLTESQPQVATDGSVAADV